jgi:hypothetical protein
MKLLIIIEEFDMLSMIFGDPVVWGSLLGILIMVIMAGYYTYMFMYNSDPDHEDKDEPK